MSLASFAGTVFEVSNKKVLTFNDLSRSGSSRWAVHDINLQKPMPEFLGPGQESLSLKILLKASLGMNPVFEVEKLRNFRDAGRTSPFILGSKPISRGHWYIEDISETYRQVDNKGWVLSIDATLSIKEYPIIPLAKEKPAAKGKTQASSSKPVSTAKHIGIVTIKAGMLNCRSSPSLKGKIVKVLRKNQTYRVYGTKKTDITWYSVGGGLYISANTKYVSFRKA
ncbi:hypothetical protein HMPREF1013_00829 [Bacillus sp. 2_A_57_CT2]|nr:hypothetical protein HMPREF1013_00829 [Bacillus sp. 2_A_57_CT2]